MPTAWLHPWRHQIKLRDVFFSSRCQFLRPGIPGGPGNPGRGFIDARGAAPLHTDAGAHIKDLRKQVPACEFIPFHAVFENGRTSFDDRRAKSLDSRGESFSRVDALHGGLPLRPVDGKSISVGTRLWTPHENEYVDVLLEIGTSGSNLAHMDADSCLVQIVLPPGCWSTVRRSAGQLLYDSRPGPGFVFVTLLLWPSRF